MRKRVVRLLGAGALLVGLMPMTACATPYSYGNEVRTSVTLAHGAPYGHWHRGRHYTPPRHYYYAPPHFHTRHEYSRWYWNQPSWWRKHNPHHWDDRHHRHRDRGHDHDGRHDHDRRGHDRD